jgi:hypothetical protein
MCANPFSPPKVSVPKAQPVPQKTDAAADAAYEEERRRLRQGTGRPSTLLTSGLGDTTAAPAQHPTTLGA